MIVLSLDNHVNDASVIVSKCEIVLQKFLFRKTVVIKQIPPD